MSRNAVLIVAGLLVITAIVALAQTSSSPPSWVRPGACVSINMGAEYQGQTESDGLRLVVVGIQGGQIILEATASNGQKQQIPIGTDGTTNTPQGKAPFLFLFLPPALRGQVQRTSDGSTLVLRAVQGGNGILVLYHAQTEMFEAAVMVSQELKLVLVTVDNNIGAPLIRVSEFVKVAERDFGVNLPTPPQEPTVPCGGGGPQPQPQPQPGPQPQPQTDRVHTESRTVTRVVTVTETAGGQTVTRTVTTTTAVQEYAPQTQQKKDDITSIIQDNILIIGGIAGAVVVAGIAMTRRSKGPPPQYPGYPQPPTYPQPPGYPQPQPPPQYSLPPAPQVLRCPNCGFTLRGNENVCPNCGYRLR